MTAEDRFVPFRPLPFERLPEQPRVPHGLAAARAETRTLETRSFGELPVHLRIHGAGPPLLLVHGLMTSSYSWRYVIEPLGRHFTVYAPDLPGSGRSGMPDASYGAERIADFLGELVDALGIRGCATVGNSLGGYLCMQLALRDATAIGRLVNLHSPGLPTPRMHALAVAMRLPGADALLGRLVARDPERWVHRNVHYYDERLKSREEARVYAEPLQTREGRRAFARILRETLDVATMRRFEEELAARRRRAEPFPVPLALLYAERDPMVPPAVGERLRALLPDASFTWLPRASHFAHVDAPERFLDAALPFLRA